MPAPRDPVVTTNDPDFGQSPAEGGQLSTPDHGAVEACDEKPGHVAPNLLR